VVSLSQDRREPCGLTYAQLSNLSDDGVMAHLARGHGDAIAVLLDRYARLVENIAFRVVRNSATCLTRSPDGLCYRELLPDVSHFRSKNQHRQILSRSGSIRVEPPIGSTT
jgi:hypothetical protein